MPSGDIGLNGNPGKGDAPRNCFSSQFRDNYDRIDWGSSRASAAIFTTHSKRRASRSWGRAKSGSTFFQYEQNQN